MRRTRVAAALAASVALASFAAPVLGEEAGASIHGFAEARVQPHYITPRGLLVTNAGVTSQILTGLVFLTSDNTSVVLGLWNDINSDPNVPPPQPNKVGAWNELDYFAGINWTPLPRLKLGASYVTFLSPPGAFETEQNIEFTANWDDSTKARKGSLQPYAKFFWAVDGDSTVVLGKRGNTFDVELGVGPTTKLGNWTVSMPTWITVGPSEYWDGRARAIGFQPSGSNLGVFSTGLAVKTDARFIPARLGRWYLTSGVQYYNLLNGNLVDANKLTTAGTGHRQVVNAHVGMGFGF